MEPEDGKADLYPVVTRYNIDVDLKLEFNFGADLLAKPFKYEFAQLNIVDV
jgi:hypothetical protein